MNFQSEKLVFFFMPKALIHPRCYQNEITHMNTALLIVPVTFVAIEWEREEKLLMEANLSPAFCCGLWIFLMDSAQHHIFVQLHFSTDLVPAAQHSTAGSPEMQSEKQHSDRDFKCACSAAQNWSAYAGHQNSGTSLTHTWISLTVRLFLQDMYFQMGCHATYQWNKRFIMVL